MRFLQLCNSVLLKLILIYIIIINIDINKEYDLYTMQLLCGFAISYYYSIVIKFKANTIEMWVSVFIDQGRLNDMYIHTRNCVNGLIESKTTKKFNKKNQIMNVYLYDMQENQIQEEVILP